MTRLSHKAMAWAILSALALAATPAHAFKEIEVQTRYCAGLPINQHLPDGSEVDCTFNSTKTGKLAIEVDFTEHWAESIGQSLHYASIQETRPAIILVCNAGTKESTCERHLARLVETLNYWRIGMFVWFCRSEVDATRDDCRFMDLYEVMQ